jgi:hypothetical protein
MVDTGKSGGLHGSPPMPRRSNGQIGAGVTKCRRVRCSNGWAQQVLTKDSLCPYVLRMDANLTVSQLADRIGAHVVGGREIPDARDQVIRQIRYWTQSGVLRPAGGTMTGTGRHRRYGVESVMVGSVLVELANTLGTGIATLKTVADNLYDHVCRGKRADPDYWRDLIKKSGRLFLQLTFDGAQFGNPPVLANAVFVPPEGFVDSRKQPMCAVVLDLEQIINRMRD